jgi:hypothetical protein
MMFQVAGKVFDYYDDILREGLTKLASAKDVTAFQDTVLLDPDDLEKLSDNKFAIVFLTKHANRVRKYPVIDSGNTWLSAQYFDMNCQRMPPAAQQIAAYHIKTAAQKYNVAISDNIQKLGSGSKSSNYFDESLNQEFVVGKEHDLPTKDFALNTGDIHKYAMPTVDHVTLAAAHFNKYAEKYEPRTRRDLAKNIVKRAADLKCDVSNFDAISKYGYANYNPRLRDYLEFRKEHLAEDQKGREVLDKMAAYIKSISPDEFATHLEEFDKRAGLTKFYDNGIPDAYESTFKVASDGSDDIIHEVDDDNIGTGKEIKAVAQNPVLLKYLGKSFTEEFQKDPINIFESLPKTEKVIIIQIAKGQLT